MLTAGSKDTNLLIVSTDQQKKLPAAGWGSSECSSSSRQDCNNTTVPWAVDAGAYIIAVQNCFSLPAEAALAVRREEMEVGTYLSTGVVSFYTFLDFYHPQ